MFVHPSLLLGLAAGQAPAVAQCPSADSARDLAWWIGALAPWIGPVLSGLASVIVAWKVFDWQQGKEHAKWIRDQRAAEWRHLLKSVVEVQRALTRISSSVYESAQLLDERLRQTLEELLIAESNCILLGDFFSNQEKNRKFFAFISEANKAASLVSSFWAELQKPTQQHTPAELEEMQRHVFETTGRIKDMYFQFQQWLRQEAAQDIERQA